MSVRWSARWRMVADDAVSPATRRMVRGREYHRAGRVTDLRASAGLLSGRVHGSRATPYPVDVQVPVLDDEQWRRVVAVLAGQARHSARVLAGQLSDGLDADLAAAGVTLLPAAEELGPSCPCDDRERFCAHVAALWEAAAVVLDDDPLLLLRLRGRGRERLLADLATARRGQAERADAGVALDQLDARGWDRLHAPLGDADVPGVAAPPTPAAALLRLGDPPGWTGGGVSAYDLFRPLVVRAGAFARRLQEPDRAEPPGGD